MQKFIIMEILYAKRFSCKFSIFDFTNFKFFLNNLHLLKLNKNLCKKFGREEGSSWRCFISDLNLIKKLTALKFLPSNMLITFAVKIILLESNTENKKINSAADYFRLFQFKKICYQCRFIC